MLSFSKVQSNAVYLYTRYTAFTLLATTLLNVVACSPQEQNKTMQVTQSSALNIDTELNSKPIDTQSIQNRAQTVTTPRSSSWLGGSPPINKRASGIDTYYQISATNKPNQLLIKM